MIKFLKWYNIFYDHIIALSDVDARRFNDKKRYSVLLPLNVIDVNAIIPDLVVITYG